MVKQKSVAAVTKTPFPTNLIFRQIFLLAPTCFTRRQTAFHSHQRVFVLVDSCDVKSPLCVLHQDKYVFLIYINHQTNYKKKLRYQIAAQWKSEKSNGAESPATSAAVFVFGERCVRADHAPPAQSDNRRSTRPHTVICASLNARCCRRNTAAQGGR